jgi:hypothetical protein
MCAPMVLATLADLKLQTRREVKNMPEIACPSVCRLVYGQHPFSPSSFVGTPAEGRIAGNDRMAWLAEDFWGNVIGAEESSWLKCPYGVPGDRLWVKETFYPHDGHVTYAADCTPAGLKQMKGMWKPSIFMPRRKSRITLEIKGIRVEPLKDISEAAAIEEGLDTRSSADFTSYRDYLWKLKEDSSHWYANPVESYASLWDMLNGAGSWAKNPWVWVIEFRRVEA